MAKHNLFIHGVSVVVNDPSIQTHHVPSEVVEEFLNEAQIQQRDKWVRLGLWPCMLAVIDFFPHDLYLAYVSSYFPISSHDGYEFKFSLIGTLSGITCSPLVGKLYFSTPESATLLLDTEGWMGGLVLNVYKAEDGTGARAELLWRHRRMKPMNRLIAELNV